MRETESEVEENDLFKPATTPTLVGRKRETARVNRRSLTHTPTPNKEKGGKKGYGLVVEVGYI